MGISSLMEIVNLNFISIYSAGSFDPCTQCFFCFSNEICVKNGSPTLQMIIQYALQIQTMSTSYGTSSSRPTSRWKRALETNLLTIFTIVGVFGGTALGLILKKSGQQWTQREVMYIQYPGDLFLRMLKCLIVPLLVSSITSAIGALDLSMSKKIAYR